MGPLCMKLALQANRGRQALESSSTISSDLSLQYVLQFSATAVLFQLPRSDPLGADILAAMVSHIHPATAHQLCEHLVAEFCEWAELLLGRASGIQLQECAKDTEIRGPAS